jgi:hypothetical protein
VDKVSSEKLTLTSSFFRDWLSVGLFSELRSLSWSSKYDAWSREVLGIWGGGVPKGNSASMLVLDIFLVSFFDSLTILAEGDAGPTLMVAIAS